ncbi:MAG: type III pantothenate kinase [Muribaculum sp.]|nr:type III pantothenate kinase [Muribaculum sp.]
MGYNLVIDQGNSAAKVAIFKGDEMVDHWRYDVLTDEVLRKVAHSFPVDSAVYCSVSNHGEDVIVLLRSMVGKVYELTSLLPLPVKVAYTTPSTLGRDRIAAVAGARKLYPKSDVLVVDAGTAVTYDVLLKDGTFVGGNIAPGLWMRAEALHQMTKRLPRVEVESAGEVADWGTDTENAIRSGVVRGVVGEISYYRDRLSSKAEVVLTGGDASRIAPLLDFKVRVDETLVLTGLNSILLYNEHR